MNEITAKITAYKNYIAIDLLETKSIKGKCTLSFDNPGYLGQVLHGTKQVGISKEALKLLAKVGKSRDDIGEIDCFRSGDNQLNFCWLGGSKKLVEITDGNELGSSSYIAPTAKDVTIIANEFPDEAKKIILSE